MESIYFLIPISIVLLGLAVWAFLWAVNNNQFDDLESPAYRILFEQETNTKNAKKQTVNQNNSTKSKK